MKKITLLFLSLLYISMGYSQIPTSDAPTPTEDSADVISIFSGNYTDISGVTLNPFWAQSGHATADTNFDRGSGDISLKYPNFNYQGIDFDGNRQNVSGMEKIHIDIWTNAVNVGFYLISAGGEVKYDITASVGSWQSLDINLSDFTGLDLTTIRQIKFDGGSGADEIYIDNIYFWKTPTAAGTDATLSDLKIDGTTVSSFTPGGENYSVGLVQGAATPVITLATPTDGSATRVITQAPSVPGNAKVVVTAADATTTKTYTVSFDYTTPNTEAPTPTKPQIDIVSIFSDTYTAPGAPNYNPNWGQSGFGSANTAYDINSDGDGNAVLSYPNFNYQGMQFTAFDASTYDFVHMDIWTSAVPENTTIQISPINNGTGGTETLVPIVYTKGTWTSVVLPKSSFTGMTWDSVFQFKIAANGISSTVPVDIFVDNIYFSKAATNTWAGTTNSDWATSTNWSTGLVPTSNTNVTIPSAPGHQPVIGAATGAVVNDLNVDNGASLNITGGGSLIVSGTSSGNVTYNRTLTSKQADEDGWHLVSSPVAGEVFDNDYVTNNSIASGNGNNRGVATYNSGWTYLQSPSGSISSTSGLGYSMKRSEDGTVGFTGAINTDNVNGVAVSASATDFVLLGVPYTAYMSSQTFLTANANLDQSQIWVWEQGVTGGSYIASTAKADNFILAPGQGFFVKKANTDATLNFAETNQQSNADTFKKSSRTEVKLFVSIGKVERFAKMYYLNDVTKGYDLGYEGETFGGVETNFDLFSHLVEGDAGENYQVQSLPFSEMESTIVPLGLKVASEQEITFSAEALNLPSGLKVYLEDRLEGVFTRLDEANLNYKVQVASGNSEGRFFLHTKSGALSTETELLNSVSIYKSNASTLRIVGLYQGKSTVKLFNVLGKQVMSSRFSVQGVKELSLPTLAKGVYIVQLETARGKLNKKIVLE